MRELAGLLDLVSVLLLDSSPNGIFEIVVCLFVRNLALYLCSVRTSSISMAPDPWFCCLLVMVIEE